MNIALAAFALAFVCNASAFEDDDETIYVVQEQVYRVTRRFELSPIFLIGVGDRFVKTIAPVARAAFHIDERFAVETLGLVAFPSETSATRELYLTGDLIPELAKLTQMRWAIGASAAWRPVQGKVQLFNGYLGTFSLQVGAGGAVIGTRVPCVAGEKIDPGGDDSKLCPTISPDALFSYEPTRARFAGVFTAAIDFSFTEYFGVRIEGRDFVFATRVVRSHDDQETPEEEQQLLISDAIRNDIFVGLGVSFRI